MSSNTPRSQPPDPVDSIEALPVEVDNHREVVKALGGGVRKGFPPPDLADRCRKAAIEGRWANTMRFDNEPSDLIIDELGYLPLPTDDANALFQVISQRCLKWLHHLDNQPRRRQLGGDVFDDTTVVAAMLDRPLQRSVLFNIAGDS